jgi:regulator of protease activity HflC (stomatin/prohibitin superfamily)
VYQFAELNIARQFRRQVRARGKRTARPSRSRSPRRRFLVEDYGYEKYDFAVEKVNQAKGEAAAKLEQALAARDQDIKHAEGDAAAFALRLDAYRKAPELTMYRLQLETIAAVLPGVQKIIRPGAGEVKDFDLWLMQPFATGGGR